MELDDERTIGDYVPEDHDEFTLRLFLKLRGC